MIDGHVGLAAGVRLDVDVLGAEELLRAVAGQVLDHIDVLAAAVVPPAGIAFGVLVREHAAGRLHDRGAGVVLAGDHLQAVLLAMNLGLRSRPKPRVFGFDEVHKLRHHGIMLQRDAIVENWIKAVNGR